MGKTAAIIGGVLLWWLGRAFFIDGLGRSGF